MDDSKERRLMPDRSIPHFHNDLGTSSIKVGVKEFMCMGASSPFDHPHIFVDMGSGSEAICSYCSTRFVYEVGQNGAKHELRDVV
jgi:uncharacterized Zn-finger protein